MQLAICGREKPRKKHWSQSSFGKHIHLLLQLIILQSQLWLIIKALIIKGAKDLNTVC